MACLSEPHGVGDRVLDSTVQYRVSEYWNVHSELKMILSLLPDKPCVYTLYSTTS